MSYIIVYMDHHNYFPGISMIIGSTVEHSTKS